MASRVGMIGCLIVVATLLMGGATADTHTVGDSSLGWSIPPTGASAYSTWASFQNFEVGDVISFSWSGTHTVAEVTETEYNNCTATNPIGPIQTTSPATFTLDNSTAPRYFICNVNGHCDRGQKVTIRLGFRSSAPSSLPTSAFSALLLALAISFLSHM